EAEALLYEVDQRLSIEPRIAPVPNFDRLQRWTDREGWMLPDIQGLHSLGTDRISREAISRGTLYPCQAIFLGKNPSEHGARAPFMVVEDAGIVVSERITRAERALLAGLAQVAQRLEENAPLQYLTDVEVEHVLSADAYRYRALVEAN